MSLPTFVTSDPFSIGQTVTLGEDEAHHIRVRRLELGEEVGLLDGRGSRGSGVLVRVAKRHAAVTVERIETSSPPPPVHLMLPVAERERMLWLAEKATELGATSWRPVLWKRSRSVNPRGEGPMFQQKVAARMAGALEQSRGAWLPVVYPDATLERAISATPEGPRIVLDIRGEPISCLMERTLATARTSGASPVGPVTIAVGPEGGCEESELAALVEAGFESAGIGSTILRFETAALAALAVVRSALATLPSRAHDQDEEPMHA
ncbi:MAG: RsmE family RNA methyltransferase [Gemmatimonadales bacterium]